MNANVSDAAASAPVASAWEVVKLGGSVLTRAGGLAAFRAWIELPSKASRVVIVGGGPLADGVRAIDAATRSLRNDCTGSEASAKSTPANWEPAHWAAIATMDATAQLVAGLCPSLRLAESLPPSTPRADWALAPARLLREEEPKWPGRRLPIGWDVTADSIAGRIASHLDAALVLAKSRTPPSGGVPSWAAEGFVDRAFPDFCPKQVRVVCF